MKKIIKKILHFIFIVIFLTACGGNSSSETLLDNDPETDTENESRDIHEIENNSLNEDDEVSYTEESTNANGSQNLYSIFENLLSELEITVESLEQRLINPELDRESFEAIQLEINELLDQIDTSFDGDSIDEYYETLCLDAGGELIFEEIDSDELDDFDELGAHYREAGGFYQCSIISPDWDRFLELIINRMFLSYSLEAMYNAYFGTTLVDFENRLDEIESYIEAFEAEVARLSPDDAIYQEREQIFPFSRNDELHTYLWSVCDGLDRYILANPNLYDATCSELLEPYFVGDPGADVSVPDSDGPQANTTQRINQLRDRLGEIMLPFWMAL